ncbi:phage head morphogenesis protein [Gluconobacter cerinus]|uniref:phage head morphogenesis protein n=1 Tax=Gluconobacter cerinus TaxID=38307 RepID=UPI001B8AD296|nr:phage minor head protein [Gluconobacter cerinus]MBS0995840.1 hypothetical protein [Gluconobacter cerinus]
MAESILQAVRLPPKDAMAYFRQKENISTDHWTDLWHEGHARGFMVAGAASQDLLKDLRTGVDKIMSQGMTMQEWRKEFPQIADRYGWQYNGSPGWRADIIYDTNMTTALSAGRYRRMVTPEALELYPFWRYAHHACLHPRPQHVAWDGLILPADDPWWQTHFPPNGWRCHCTVEVVSRAKLKRMGWEVSEAPPIETRPWINPRNGTVHQVPVGIDPGFAYNPGRAWKTNEDIRSGRPQSRFVAEDAGPTRAPNRQPIAPETTGVRPSVVPETAPHVQVPEPAQHRPLSEPEQRHTDIKGMLDILHSPDGTRELPVGTVPSDVQAALGAKSDRALFSTVTARKQLKNHADLTDDDYRLLPEILSDPAVIAHSRALHVLLFRRLGKLYRAVVKVTQDGQHIYVQSFHVTTVTEARRAMKGRDVVKGTLADLEEDGDAPAGPHSNPA